MRQFFKRTYNMYYDGFKSMTIGRKLWILIIVKLAIIFLVLKLFFFPDILHTKYDSDTERSQAVRESMMSKPED